MISCPRDTISTEVRSQRSCLSACYCSVVETACEKIFQHASLSAYRQPTRPAVHDLVRPQPPQATDKRTLQLLVCRSALLNWA